MSSHSLKPTPLSERTKESISKLSSLSTKNSRILLKLIKSDFKSLNFGTFTARDKITEKLSQELEISIDEGKSVYYGMFSLLELYEDLDIANLEKTLSKNGFNPDQIDKTLHVMSQLLKTGIVDNYLYRTNHAKTESAILPHLNNIKWQVDYRLVSSKDKKEFELIPTVICTIALHNPDHSDRPTNLYFQASSDIVDIWVNDLHDLQKELKSNTEYLNSKIKRSSHS